MPNLSAVALLAVVTFTYAFILADAGALAGGMRFLGAWIALFALAVVSAFVTSSHMVVPAGLSGLLAVAIYGVTAGNKEQLSH